MGEHEVWSPAGDLHLNGLLPNEVSNVTQFLDEERWSKAEERTAELLACIQPNQPSEERRNAVANYVQRLIMKCFSCEVFTFGSVPLKTYLPDGDIDLTAFSKNDDLKDTWAAEVREALENEEKSESSEFRVREVQYIQAEVKIIKCLVENIVVDISFNQVGGLCTLCFLEEIDHLINQNHLFKRSIILIKAWCYYESRILGAHHGLISTYALETLVLYIFHVFNNSFAGPLEVLYRFLEFFSRFDWDNFCISLWGPVPISSLPDMAAEPPRKDGGELLLNGDFLVNCSTMYAVFPSGQENHGQQFVSKHFNVIDPLRTNNNLGRSVSKGNFYRVRSAFAFGAKRLARLLGCPKENLIDEVNQFFMNTWQRHMTANRPDAPAPTNLYAQPEKNVPTEESSHSTESATEHQSKRRIDLHGSVSSTIQRSNAYRTTNSSMVSRSPSQKVYVKPVQNQKNLKANYADQEGQGSLHFARTQSSPSLTESSTATLYRARRGRVADTSEAFDENLRPDYENRRKNTNSEILTIRSTRSSFDEPSLLGPNLSEHNRKAASDSNSIPNSYHGDTCLTTGDEEVTSVSTALELQQQEQLEQQDMVNMMASSQVHNFIGQVQLPMHFSMPHHLPISSFFNSMAYGQRNLVTLVDPSWGSAMQFPQGFISPHLPQHISNASTSKSNFEELETSNESSDVTLLNQENREHSGWHDSDIGSIQGFETDVGELVTIRSDERRQNPSARQNTSSRVSNPRASVMRSHQKIAAENDRFRDDKSANLRHIPVPQAREGSKNLKAARNKWGRSPSNSEIMNSSLGRNDSKLEVTPEPVSSQEDNERGSLSSAHSGSQLAGYEHAQISGADSLVPFAPILVSGSRQKVPDGSGVLPFTFFPTGPPVPFVTMVPVYNFQADGSNSDRDIREGNFDFAEHYDQFENLVNLNTSKGPEDASSEEHKPDILNSDFVSHWQNLQYGRLCQNIRSHGPFVYSPPVVVPPTYLQGHFPMDGPGRPHSANANFFTQVSGYGPRLVPIALQPGPSRPSGVHNQYGDDSPRYRGGTGTYLPNPASLRERQFSTSRNHRSGYRHDRADETDREGSWINAKSRAAGRSHVRNQHEKSIPRSDRSITSDSRPWESYRPDQVAFHQPQNVPFRSSNLSSEPATPPYNLYPSSGSRSNNVVMLYPNDPHLGYRSTTDSLEFGSLGRVHMSNNEASIPCEGNPIRRLHDPRHSNRGVSQRSSPDQPSSPHITRAP